MDAKTLLSWFQPFSKAGSAKATGSNGHQAHVAVLEPEVVPQAPADSSEDAAYAALRQELMGQLAALHNAAIVSETDIRGNITFANEIFVRVSKYSLDELMGRNHRILKSGLHPDEVYAEMWRTISGGQYWQGEVSNRAKDGSIYWVVATITPVLDKKGYPVKYISVRFEITAQKQAELEAQQAVHEIQMHEEELTQTLEELTSTTDELTRAQLELRGQIQALNNAAIVSEADLRGTITSVNDTFCAISKYHRMELLGQNHRMLKSNEHPPESYEQLWRTISRGDMWRGQLKNRAKDGSHYWVDATITPVIGPDGKPVKYVSVRFDITQQMELQQELLVARERLSAQVDEQRHELQDSVDYAERIQQAMMHTDHDLQLQLPAGWTAARFQRARNSVSGDFTWVGKWKNKSVVALGDGTGHGVPGAFMSIIGMTTLAKLVEDRGMIDPSSLLDEIDQEIRRVLHQEEGRTGASQDSIEMSIVTITEGRNTISIGNAMRTAYLGRPGHPVDEIPADRRPLGGTLHGTASFSHRQVELQPGDTLFLVSDGYADQQGGPEKRRLGRQAFRDILDLLSLLPVDQHADLLAQRLAAWQGPLDQTDDIAILSLRYQP